ncbi:branched-chain amino acid ABC transporter permease [Rhizobium chutanense]|uniref:Branched-chain amino acid ABC transporter permease n=1 Tax=Rhizobium chutanense TaxID=2035448 RepID=A0A2A6J3K9_9HYPH|nr:branched-chain amino acid ABC transporter permease [Rhizobium chutanense]PDT00423.1 branched-chain amino acid ABC transporter permease [Rhizobium chutanense]
MKNLTFPIALAVLLAVLALVPVFIDEYGLGLAIGAMSYVALCSSWALFSGPTRYISLATVAFFGTGAYTVAILADYLPFYAILAVAALVGLITSLVVGLATLRLAGIYFVIFTFGLAEMVRQLLTWYEVNVTGTLGRYIFVEIKAYQIFYKLLAVAAVALVLRWWMDRGRLGLAVRAIGDDEMVARHAGVDVTRVKLILFSISSMLITLVGAIQAPRWTYVEPSIVFNPTISFLTLIMALLGGASRLWGPACGAVPLFFLFEWLSGRFPDHYSIILGLLFIGIVFLFPEGVLARVERLWKRLVRREECENSAKEVSNERLA